MAKFSARFVEKQRARHRSNTHTALQHAAPALELERTEVEVLLLPDGSDPEETRLPSYAETPFKHGAASPHCLDYAKMFTHSMRPCILACVVLTCSSTHMCQLRAASVGRWTRTHRARRRKISALMSGLCTKDLCYL